PYGFFKPGKNFFSLVGVFCLSFFLVRGGPCPPPKLKKRVAKAGSRLLKTKTEVYKLILTAFFIESHDFGSKLLFLHIRRKNYGKARRCFQESDFSR
ncbi:hypothetical protein, partial [Chryseobacterium indologenes]|uniref:hypothetical protein n=2 Tax=Chryseobacterium indologenes TaxID=253 RepID=UPI001E37C56A